MGVDVASGPDGHDVAVVGEDGEQHRAVVLPWRGGTHPRSESQGQRAGEAEPCVSTTRATQGTAHSSSSSSKSMNSHSSRKTQPLQGLPQQSRPCQPPAHLASLSTSGIRHPCPPTSSPSFRPCLVPVPPASLAWVTATSPGCPPCPAPPHQHPPTAREPVQVPARTLQKGEHLEMKDLELYGL